MRNAVMFATLALFLTTNLMAEDLPPLNLTPDQNATLKTKAGTTVKIADIFTTKYILVDFSQSGCGYCIDLSGEMNTSATRQKSLSGTDCRLVTLVPKNDLGNWLNVVSGGNSFVGKNSYEVTKSLGSFATAYKYSLTGTPTLLLINRNGQIVTSELGMEPTNLDSYCKQ